jgi:hypothetical protein
MVSVLFHSPHRGAFHRSLAVLFAIGLRKYLALPVSSGMFTRAIRVSSYSRTIKKSYPFRLRGFHPLGRRFPAASATDTFCNFLHLAMRQLPYDPANFSNPSSKLELSEKLDGLG